ncbi:MAG: hypothetical protein ACOYM3_21615 [Terrimicrobiaceae bacterium]|jgi:hypothetical protein
MKTPITHTLAAILALTLSLGTARAEVLLEDTFSSSPGQSAPASVAGRDPAKGPKWDGTAMVDGGKGLVHDPKLLFSAAFSEINVPQDFKKLIVKIRYQPVNGRQFGFGFANTDAGLRENLGDNRGLMWAGMVNRQACILAGIYGSGEGAEGLPIPSEEPIPRLVQMEFEIENVGDPRTFLGRLVVNGTQLVAQEVLATEPPTFRFFFIQFRGEDGESSQAIVEEVSVEVER